MIKIRRTLNRAMNKAAPVYHRNTICVVLPDGFKLRVSNRAAKLTAERKRRVTISEVIREAVVKMF